MSITTSEKQTPPFPTYGNSFERGLDPWHKDAFPSEYKDVGTNGERKSGWFTLDWCGNVIGFTPDGTEYEI